MSKVCFKCGEVKHLSEFYKHKQMRDGHLNKCKSCSKSDSTSNRLDNIEKVRKYDRDRGNRQDIEYLKGWRVSNPKKYKAHNMVNNQIRAGNLHRKPCEICNEGKTVAHHDNYDQPLNVRWLCQAHHKQWHAEHGEGENSH